MSQLWKLTKSDYLKGLVVAIIAAVLTVILQTLQNSQQIDWNQVLTTGLIAGLGYILKNLATDESGKLGGKYQL